MSYAVPDPQIDEVLDLETGECIRADALIGADYGHVMQLRLAVRSDIAREEPRFICPLCHVAVYLIRLAAKEHFFFRHDLEDGRCKARTRGELSEREILARKYDAYTTVDFGATYDFNEHVTLNAAVYNLFDKRVDVDEFNTSVDGRRLWVSMTSKF